MKSKKRSLACLLKKVNICADAFFHHFFAWVPKCEMVRPQFLLFVQLRMDVYKKSLTKKK